MQLMRSVKQAKQAQTTILMICVSRCTQDGPKGGSSVELEKFSPRYPRQMEPRGY